MLCCQNLGPPPGFTRLPSRMTAFVSMRMQFECNGCGRDVQMDRLQAFVDASPAQCCSVHGDRALAVMYQGRGGEPTLMHVCLSTSITNYQALDCKGVIPPPSVARDANDRPPHASLIRRALRQQSASSSSAIPRSRSRSRASVHTIMDSPSTQPPVPQNTILDSPSTQPPDAQNTILDSPSTQPPDAQPWSPSPPNAQPDPDSQEILSGRRLLRRYTSDTLRHDLEFIRRDLHPSPRANNEFAMIDDIVRGHTDDTDARADAMPDSESIMSLARLVEGHFPSSSFRLT